MEARQLKPHERIWLEEMRTRLASGQSLEYRELMVTLRDRLPNGFTPNQIDSEYLRGTQLTVSGIHALDPNAQELKDLERLILAIKDLLINDFRRQEVSADECSAMLGIPKLYATRLLALAGTLSSFWSGTSATPDSLGLSKVVIQSLESFATLLGFTSVDDSLRDRARKKQQSGSPDSWSTSTFSPTNNSENDPTEEDNAPFTAEEQAQAKRAIEEFRVYITSTYSLTGEPLAKVNRKLDYLIDASTRLGRKDWTIICLGIFVTLAIPQLTPLGPSVRELVALAWQLVRHVLGGVISPPLLH